jgi:hypothetical protein
LVAHLGLVFVIDFRGSRGLPGAAIGTQITGGFSKKLGYSTAKDALWRAGTWAYRPAYVEEVGHPSDMPEGRPGVTCSRPAAIMPSIGGRVFGHNGCLPEN